FFDSERSFGNVSDVRLRNSFRTPADGFDDRICEPVGHQARSFVGVLAAVKLAGRTDFRILRRLEVPQPGLCGDHIAGREPNGSESDELRVDWLLCPISGFDITWVGEFSSG